MPQWRPIQDLQTARFGFAQIHVAVVVRLHAPVGYQNHRSATIDVFWGRKFGADGPGLVVAAACVRCTEGDSGN